MAATRIPATRANLALDAGWGNDANSGKVRIYSGTQPAAGGGALSGNVLLLEFNLQPDAFPGASGGVLTAANLSAAAGLANGVATWFRVVRSDGSTVLWDGDVGLAGSGADCIIDDVNVSVGDASAVVSLTLALPLS